MTKGLFLSHFNKRRLFALGLASKIFLLQNTQEAFAARTTSFQFAGGGIASGVAGSSCQITLQRLSGGNQNLTIRVRTNFGTNIAAGSGSYLQTFGDASCGFSVTQDATDKGLFRVTFQLSNTCEGANIFSVVYAYGSGASFPECSGGFEIAEEIGAVLASGTMYFYDGVGTGWPRGSTTGIINGGRPF